MDERDIENSEARVELERNCAAARVSAAVSEIGSSECMNCGELIEAARREAAPFAKRCIECQRATERKDRLYA